VSQNEIGIMKTFPGFSEEKSEQIPIPSSFFTEVLCRIDHLGELKTTLYAFWYFEKQEGEVLFLQLKDLVSDKKFLAGLSGSAEEAEKILEESLSRAVQRGTLLKVEMKKDEGTLFLLNTPRGRAAVKAIQKGEWDPRKTPRAEVSLENERPDIFQLYEKNIGPLTPMIAEDLKEAEITYPIDWVRDAIHIAVQKNVRRWNYVSAILKSWKEKGRHEEDRRGREEDRGKYVQGDYGDLIKH
jgi:DnaD/phage-associated family protein